VAGMQTRRVLGVDGDARSTTLAPGTPVRRARCAPLVLAGLALAACGPHDNIKPDYRPVSMVPVGTRWIGPVTLIGDDQKFHIGDKAFLFRSGFTDAHVSDSAVRVPQQDLFGDSLLALAAKSKDGVVAHLGDAMDLSCADEWDEFSRIMDQSGSRWFWTPGNHDGYFFGNFVAPQTQWNDACFPSQPITMARAIERYVTEHLTRYAGGALDLQQSSWSCPSAGGCRGLLRAAWSVRRNEDYYTSFLIQEIEIPAGPPAASLILVDTSTYDRPPKVIAPGEPGLHLAAGQTGGLGPTQLSLLEDWIRQAALQGRTVVVAGHHPFSDIDQASQAVLSRLIEAGQVVTYISAHTHWGQYFTHADSHGYAWLEPNLGSIIDYDSEFGTLTLGFHDEAKFVRMARTPTSSFTGDAYGDLGIRCENPEWLARPDDPDFYTRYKTTRSPQPTAVELLYYSTMLAALDRYWRCVPTDDSAPPPGAFSTSDFQDCPSHRGICRPDSEVHAAIQDTLATGNLDQIRKKVLDLLALDRTRPADTCLRREYRVCQALWGAEYEKRDYITPIKHTDVFEVHTAHRTVPAARSTP
jgi:calcineurin-like phosphoesterase family protein